MPKLLSLSFLKRRRLPSAWRAHWDREAVALFGVAAPVVYLAWRRGGAAEDDQTAAFIWVLALAALLCFAGRRSGLEVTASWPVVLLPCLALLQMIPLGTGGSFPPFYSAAASRFAEFGVEPWGTVSVYPYATLRAGLMVAGCCALFTLARTVCVRSQRCFWIIALPLVALGAAEAVMGWEQYVRGQHVDGAAGAVARGTFVNRDHYAALVEGCLALALGLGVSLLVSREKDRWTSWRLASGPLAAAGLCLLAILFSLSRAGILVAAVIATTALVLVATRSRPAALAIALLMAVAVLAASAADIGGIGERFLALAAEGEDGSRISIWRDSLWSTTPYSWTGSGLGTFAFVFRRSEMYLPLKTVDHAHSDYLEALVELGWPTGLLLLSALAVAMARLGREIFRIDHLPQGALAMGCWLGVAGILLHAWVDFPLRIPAIAALVAVLAGSAAGLGAGQRSHNQAPQWAAGLAGLFFAICGIGLLAGAAQDRDAQGTYERGAQSMARGQWKEADALYVQALRENPYAAKVWLERAEIAEIAGDQDKAVRIARLARQIEPHTLRIEWPLANLHLRAGDFENAAVPLRTLAEAIPGMRATLFTAAWRAGMPPGMITRLLVPPTGAAIGEYLCFLAQKKEWGDIVPAYRQLNARNDLAVPDAMIQYTLDRLLDAGLATERKRLQDLL